MCSQCLWWHHNEEMLPVLLALLLWGESTSHQWISLAKGQWCGTLTLTYTSCWTNSGVDSDLICSYYVTVMNVGVAINTFSESPISKTNFLSDYFPLGSQRWQWGVHAESAKMYHQKVTQKFWQWFIKLNLPKSFCLIVGCKFCISSGINF